MFNVEVKSIILCSLNGRVSLSRINQEMNQAPTSQFLHHHEYSLRSFEHFLQIHYAGVVEVLKDGIRAS